MKKVASLFGPDNLRIGVVHAKRFPVFLFFSKVRFCFERKNGNRPAFFGWSTEDGIKKFIRERFPDAKWTTDDHFDDLLDNIEAQMMRNR